MNQPTKEIKMNQPTKEIKMNQPTKEIKMNQLKMALDLINDVLGIYKSEDVRQPADPIQEKLCAAWSLLKQELSEKESVGYPLRIIQINQRKENLFQSITEAKDILMTRCSDKIIEDANNGIPYILEPSILFMLPDGVQKIAVPVFELTKGEGGEAYISKSTWSYIMSKPGVGSFYLPEPE